MSNPMVIRWYSLNQKLETLDHDAISTDEALEIADRYLSALRSHYESGEEAMEATVFGLVRDDGSYMQVCLHRHDWIDVEYDFAPISGSPFRRLVSHQRQHSERLDSREYLRNRIALFFAHSSEGMRQHLANAPARGV